MKDIDLNKLNPNSRIYNGYFLLPRRLVNRGTDEDIKNFIQEHEKMRQVKGINITLVPNWEEGRERKKINYSRMKDYDKMMTKKHNRSKKKIKDIYKLIKNKNINVKYKNESED